MILKTVLLIYNSIRKTKIKKKDNVKNRRKRTKKERSGRQQPPGSFFYCFFTYRSSAIYSGAVPTA